MSTQAISSPAETAPRANVHAASVVAAVALVVSGLALVVAELVLADNAIPDGAAGLVVIQANMQAYMLSKWIGLVFTLCMPLGLIGVAALAYQRRAWAAYIGASLTILGGLFHAAAYTFEGVIVPAMARMADHQPDMAALLDRINSNPAVYPLFALMILFNLGLLIMAIGLWRKGIVPIWVAGLGVAATLAHFAPIPELVALILLTGFLAGVGLGLIRHAQTEALAR
ncbi:MAG: hypothetical protein ACJ8CR_29690 [Roseiflexaceae bacterium]